VHRYPFSLCFSCFVTCFQSRSTDSCPFGVDYGECRVGWNILIDTVICFLFDHLGQIGLRCFLVILIRPLDKKKNTTMVYFQSRCHHATISLVLLVLSLDWTPCLGFEALVQSPFCITESRRHHVRRATSIRLFSKLFDDDNGDFEDYEREKSKADIQAKNEGQEMASDFYKMLRKQQQQEDSQTEETFSSKPNPASLPSSSSSPFDYSMDRQFTPSTRSSSPSASSKFTGQGYVPPSRSTRGEQEVGGDASRMTPREEMFQREFNLASRGASYGLAIQAVFAVLLLAFYIYVGVTGGIVTGQADDDRFFGGDDMIPIEQVIPVPKDTETSVWL
jgi:hypothetical protein